MLKLPIKKLHKDATLPTKAYEGDAGWDLYACEDLSLAPALGDYDIAEINAGIAVAIPEGYYGQVMCRSGLGKKGLRVHHGVIDAGYRGPVTIFVQNQGKEFINIKKGDKAAQLLILPVPDVKLYEVMELPESERGVKGFGSSDRRK